MNHDIAVTAAIKALFKRKAVYVQWNQQFDAWTGTLHFDDNLRIEPQTLQEMTGGNLYTMGAYSYMRSNLHIPVKIGRYTSIGLGVKSTLAPGHKPELFSTSPIVRYNHDIPIVRPEFTAREDEEDIFQAIDWQDEYPETIIGNDVWIGDNVTLKLGIKVGDGAVIGENAYVTHDVPPYTVVGGLPARLIKSRFSESIINRLMDLKWWDYNYEEFSGIRGDDKIETFIYKFSELVDSGEIKKYVPEVLTARDILEASK